MCLISSCASSTFPQEGGLASLLLSLPQGQGMAFDKGMPCLGHDRPTGLGGQFLEACGVCHTRQEWAWHLTWPHGSEICTQGSDFEVGKQEFPSLLRGLFPPGWHQMSVYLWSQSTANGLDRRTESTDIVFQQRHSPCLCVCNESQLI